MIKIRAVFIISWGMTVLQPAKSGRPAGLKSILATLFWLRSSVIKLTDVGMDMSHKIIVLS